MTQKEALNILKMGHNVFLTGPAGSGKTYLLNQYISYLKSHNIPIGITASTGIAATHMGGVTIHSWTGMGIKDDIPHHEIINLLKRPYLRNHYKRAKVLIIDEISMLHAHRLELVNKMYQAFYQNDLPFGGIQIIMCGDFFQLPPVTRSTESHLPQTTETRKIAAENLAEHFTYNANIWNTMNLKICYLEEQHRQDDRAFLRVLNDIRNNEVNELTVEYLTDRLNKPPEGYSQPTRLYARNANVDEINQEQLDLLPGELHEYYMNHHGNLKLTEVLQKSCLAPQVLQLKTGAQVMFVKNNYEAGFVNGTLGEIINFTPEDYPIVRTFDGNEIIAKPMDWEVKENETILASISQIPLRLAWAITIHKSQGMTLDAAEVDLSKSFVPGMGYVALSRVRSLKGLNLLGLNQIALTINSDVAKKDKYFLERSNQTVLALQKLDKNAIQTRHKAFLEKLKTQKKTV